MFVNMSNIWFDIPNGLFTCVPINISGGERMCTKATEKNDEKWMEKKSKRGKDYWYARIRLLYVTLNANLAKERVREIEEKNDVGNGHETQQFQSFIKIEKVWAKDNVRIRKLSGYVGLFFGFTDSSGCGMCVQDFTLIVT